MPLRKDQQQAFKGVRVAGEALSLNLQRNVQKIWGLLENTQEQLEQDLQILFTRLETFDDLLDIDDQEDLIDVRDQLAIPDIEGLQTTKEVLREDVISQIVAFKASLDALIAEAK